MDFSQSNTWIFLFLISNESLDPIWKVYGLGFSKKSLDCKNSWSSKTGILKFLLPFIENFEPSYLWTRKAIDKILKPKIIYLEVPNSL